MRIDLHVHSGYAPNGKPVPIDLGSTSYRPVQFELVALIETPKCGLDELTEEERTYLVAQRWCISEDGPHVKTRFTDFDRLFQMASYLKNFSGVASRIQHIKNNKEKIAAGLDVEMYSKRLEDNLKGRDFHISRALAANEKLLGRGYLDNPELRQTKLFLEELKQGKYI